jgi:hypothetical protein
MSSAAIARMLLADLQVPLREGKLIQMHCGWLIERHGYWLVCQRQEAGSSACRSLFP